MGNETTLEEERIGRVNELLNEELNNIASNMGITKSQFLRREIREIMNETEIRVVDSDDSTVYVTGMTDEFRQQITKLAKDMSITRNSLLKVMLYDISKKYSKNMGHGE